MIFSVRKFRHYLLGREVIFHVDHYSLKHLVKKADLSGRIARWILRLQEFDITVEWRKGIQHKNADYLSRLKHLHGEAETLEDDLDFPDENLYQTQSHDLSNSWYEDVWNFLLFQEYPKLMNREEKLIFLKKIGPYEVRQNTLFKLGMDEVFRWCLEKEEVLTILEALHSGLEGGHFGVQTTAKKILTGGYKWPTLFRDTADFIKRCDACQRTGRPTATTRWPLVPIMPLAPFERWGIDSVGPVKPANYDCHKDHMYVGSARALTIALLLPSDCGN
ncbi:hypothetical protein R1sor_018040 [Riccia sorocarpa]|uniref:Integrase zinc-binding domain-containing protein n=1 Tax=Riccia sorocarpa TaxID=122646 RepID=A0ABD3I8K0_9MARC